MIQRWSGGQRHRECFGRPSLSLRRLPGSTPAVTAENRVTDEGRWSLKPVGRLKDMLKVGGSNVSPTEVERYIDQHDGVSSSVVVGVSDDHLHEVPFAFIVSKAGQGPNEAEVIAFCKPLMASYKVARYVAFMEAFPRLSSGKIDRLTLAARARGLVKSTNPVGERA